MNLRLELVLIPVSDVERAKDFYVNKARGLLDALVLDRRVDNQDVPVGQTRPELATPGSDRALRTATIW